jgi:acyl carrier protein
MNDQDPLDTQIKAIFQRLFQVDPQRLNDETRRGGLPRWDSLGHLNLLSSLEGEFNIAIPLEQALAMETFADVKRTVAELRANPRPA